MIFCHGLTCNRSSYSGMCREFASHGYIVFSLDHFDGSCHYTVKRSGQEKYWSSLHDPKDKEIRNKQLQIRIQEINDLVDELQETDYLQKKLGFASGVRMDLEKLIVGGHSFGGMTALSVCQQNEKVKATFGLDDWIWC